MTTSVNHDRSTALERSVINNMKGCGGWGGWGVWGGVGGGFNRFYMYVHTALSYSAWWSPCSGRKELVCLLLVHLFVYFVWVTFCLLSRPSLGVVGCGIWVWLSIEFSFFVFILYHFEKEGGKTYLHVHEITLPDFSNDIQFKTSPLQSLFTIFTE